MAAHLFFLLTLLFIIGVSINNGLNYMCPGVVDATQYYKKVYFEPKLGGRSGEGYAKMRFRIFDDESMDKLPPVVKYLTQEVADFWWNVLSVRPFDGTMFIERKCVLPIALFTLSNVTKKREQHCLEQCANETICVETVVPEEHLKECSYCSMNGTECQTTGRRGKGIENTDMVFYVASVQTKHCDGPSIAYASSCNTDPYLDRPIVGGLNICPLKALQLLNTKEHLVSIIKHEMMHALGFSPSLYNYFRDSNGKPLVERDEYGRPTFNWLQGEFNPNVRKTIERQWHVRGGTVSSNRTFIVTPNVVREARVHFNCTELEGAELEEFERKGTGGAHLETRVYHDDLMKGGADDGEQRMSRLDLALLEDTGWYKVNYSFAEPMKYGRDLGCDFCMKSCKYWMDKKRSEGKSVEPFCDQTAEQSSNYLCNKTEKIYSGCPLVRKEDPVPKEHQYFDKLEGVKDDGLHFYSGMHMLADFCPIPLKDFIVPCNQQITPEDKLKNIPLESYGNDSYCFQSSKNWTLKEYKDTCSQVKTYHRGQNAGCYEYSCLSGLLVIQVLNRKFPCFFKGQVLEVNLFGLSGNATHEGTIVCPSCEQMCGQSSYFKCMPENPILASKYPYVRDECIDGNYLKKMIKSLDEEGKKSSTVIKDLKEAVTMESDTWTKLESLTPIERASEALRNSDKFHQRSHASKLGPSLLIIFLFMFPVIMNY